MNQNVTGGTYPSMCAKKVYDRIYQSKYPDDFAMPNSVKYQEIDLNKYYQDKTVCLADNSQELRYKKRELFSIYNPPQTSPKIIWDTKIDGNNTARNTKKGNFFEKLRELIKKGWGGYIPQDA